MSGGGDGKRVDEGKKRSRERESRICRQCNSCNADRINETS
jgi:hypothetical protein